MMAVSKPVDAVIGIDLGGTLVRVGALDRRGYLLGWQEAPIEAAQGPQVGLLRIEALIESVLGQAGETRLLGIGVGSTGPVDREKGAIQNPYTLPTWEDVDILSPLKARYGVPAVLENDADAAALGEYWRGAGQGVARLIMVTVGTGIGTAFVYHGELYRGLGGIHPEGGHQVIDPDGPECYCGARGCWEVLASGSAIARAAREKLSQAGPSLLLEMAGGDLQAVDTALVAQAAGRGDLLAGEVIETAAGYLALGLANLITLFLPEVILLGGGVMQAYPLFQPIVQAVIARQNVVVPATAVEVRLAELGGQAGVFGAGYAVLHTIAKSS